MNKIILTIFILCLAACSSDHSAPITTPPPENASDTNDGTDDGGDGGETLLSFEKDILPIVGQRCTLCHSEGSGLTDYTDYETSLNNTAQLLNRVSIVKDMPRNNATQMTQQERDLFAQWINEGAMP